MRDSRIAIVRNREGNAPPSDENLSDAFRLPDYRRVAEAMTAGREQIRNAIKTHLDPLRIPESILAAPGSGRRRARRKKLGDAHPEVLKAFEAVAAVRRSVRSLISATLPTLGLSTEYVAQRVKERDLPPQIRTRKSNPWIFLKPPYDFRWATHDLWATAGHIFEPEHLFSRTTGNVGWVTRYSVDDAGITADIFSDLCDKYQAVLTSEVGSTWTSKKKGIPTAWVKWVCRKSKSACEVEDLAGYSDNEEQIDSWFTFSFTKQEDPERRIHKFWSDRTIDVPDDTFTYTRFGGLKDEIVWFKIKGTKEIAAGDHTAFAGIDMTQIAAMDDVDVAWEVTNNWKIAEIDIEAPE